MRSERVSQQVARNGQVEVTGVVGQEMHGGARGRRRMAVSSLGIV